MWSRPLWRGMDTVGFRTLGRSAARDAKLGEGADECYDYHDLAGGDGDWGSDLWFGYLNSRGKLTLLGAAVLFLTSLLLTRRLSINVAGTIERGYRASIRRCRT